MLEKIISFTLKQKGLVIGTCALIIALGIYAAYTIPIDAFPDVTNNQVEIISHADGLSALEIERTVTLPIEMSMRGIPGVQQMRSVMRFGLSIVTLIFDDDVEIYFARQQVFERLAEAKESVPEGVEVALGPVATVMGEIYQYTLKGNMPEDPEAQTAYLAELRTLQEWIITPVLKNVRGVSEINSFGGHFKEYQVIIDPSKLIKYNTNIEDVFTTLENSSQNRGGNILEKNSEQYIVRSIGLLKNISDIGNTVIKNPGGIPVFLKDIAEIKVGQAVRLGAATINGSSETVGGIVMMLRGENSREVVERVKEKVRSINESRILPDGITIEPFYDRSEIVNSSIFTMIKALLEGSILVLIITYILLRSFRGSAVILIALPVSLLLTFVIMKLTGISANLMSIGGLVISTGMKFDASIIQVENVQRVLNEQGRYAKKFLLVLKAILEVRKPSIFGELIIAVTFVPILALEGIEGKMFSPLALTVGIAILATLLMSIFIIPVLCIMLLKPQPEKENYIMNTIKEFYIKILQFSIRKKAVVLSTAGAFFIAALLLIPRLGTEFIPIMDEGAFDMDIALLPGVSLDKAIEINQLAAKKLKQFPELEVVVGRTGQTGLALDTRCADKTGYVGVLKPKKEWEGDHSREELMNEMRESLESIPGISFGFSQPIQCRIDEIVAGTKAQLILKLFGEDLDLLKKKADEIARVLSLIEGGTDIMVEKITGQPYLTVDIDREKIARYGLHINDVQKIIGMAVAGKSAAKLYEENKSFDIVVRFPEENRGSIETIGNILIPTHSGANIPLAQLASIDFVEGPAQISREDALRRIGIEINVTGRDIGTFVNDAKHQIKEKIDLPPSYFITWGGQFENQQRAMTKLMIIAPVAIGLIFLLLFLTFRSVRLCLLVVSNLPFALIGGVFSLYISGLYLSVPASIGFIVLFGVAVLNGIVLVSHISQLREEGSSLEQAIMRGSVDRLRPVLMTALISIFSLIPTLFAAGTGSEVQRPLATVVVGGLITSTILTLIIIPTVYSWFDKKRSPEIIPAPHLVRE